MSHSLSLSVSESSNPWIAVAVVLGTLLVGVVVLLAVLVLKGVIKLNCKKGEFK